MNSIRLLTFAAMIAGALVASVSAQEDAAAAEAALTPDGIWEANNGITRYRIVTCGDGELCAYLHWIRPNPNNEQYRQYLGEAVFEELPLVGPLKWRGPVTVLGHTVNGTIELIAADELHLTACRLLILCQSTVLTRVADDG